jgi:hypothetical protein
MNEGLDLAGISTIVYRNRTKQTMSTERQGNSLNHPTCYLLYIELLHGSIPNKKENFSAISAKSRALQAGRCMAYHTTSSPLPCFATISLVIKNTIELSVSYRQAFGGSI